MSDMIEIREARDADAGVVTGLVRELATSGGEKSPVTEAYVHSYLATPGSQVLLATRGAEVLGLLSYSVRPSLYHAADGGLIEELVVRQEARGQGVASALMREVMRRLEAAGCAEVSVSAMSDNEGAIRFYRSHGLVDEALYLERHF